MQGRSAAARLVDAAGSRAGGLTYQLNRDNLRIGRRREGPYLLRTNLTDHEPDALWRYCMPLVFVEEAFRTLKGDLALRPISHQKPERIEAPLFGAFLAYCPSITLRQKLRSVASGQMPRFLLEKLATVQMLDVCVPTVDGLALLLVRRTEPSAEVALLLERLDLALPPQPLPKLRYPAQEQAV